MSAIALAFGALTLGVPHLQDTAAASLAEKKSPSPSGVKLAAPFWWGQQEDVWTNDGVSCPAHLTPPVKEKLLKLTANTTASSYCDPTARSFSYCDHFIREKVFSQLDKDDSGTVTKSEVEDCLVSQGESRKDAVYVVAMYDENGDGEITKKEFNDAMVCVNSCNVANKGCNRAGDC